MLYSPHLKSILPLNQFFQVASTCVSPHTVARPSAISTHGEKMNQTAHRPLASGTRTCRVLDRHPHTLTAMRRRGEIDFVLQPNGRYLYDLDGYLAKQQAALKAGQAAVQAVSESN